MHELAKLFHLAAAHRNLKLKVTKPQNIGVVEPWFDFANFVQIDAVRAVTAKKCAGGSLLQNSVIFIGITNDSFRV